MRVDEWLSPYYGYSLQGVDWLVQRKTRYQLLEVGRNVAFGNFLRLDGAFQCSETDEFFYHEPIVHSALLMAAAPRRVLIIGGGDGGAAEEALKWPQLECVDHVEIDAEVVDACRTYLRSVHRGVLDGADARHRLFIGDGRAWLTQAARGQASARYDAIVLDLTDPGGPSSELHDHGFYSACKAALAPGGTLSLHIAAPWAQSESCAERILTLRGVFDCVMPFEVSIPMSGGPWLMAVCGAAGMAVPSRAQTAAQLGALRGPALQCISEQTFVRQFALAPYLQRRLAA